MYVFTSEDLFLFDTNPFDTTSMGQDLSTIQHFHVYVTLFKFFGSISRFNILVVTASQF